MQVLVLTIKIGNRPGTVTVFDSQNWLSIHCRSHQSYGDGNQILDGREMSL